MPRICEPAVAQEPSATIVRNPEEQTEAAELVSAISTDMLAQRPSRPADYAAENRALIALMQKMANAPDEILQAIADTALTLCRAGSAGLSLLEKADEGQRFHWRAIAGQWAPHLGGATPRGFCPSGAALDRNSRSVSPTMPRRKSSTVKKKMRPCTVMTHSDRPVR